MLISSEFGINLNAVKVWYKKTDVKYALCALCNDVEFVEMQKFVEWHLKCMNSSNVKRNMAVTFFFSVSFLSLVPHMKLMLFYVSRRQARL
jgi:hypothetical protein